MCSGISRISLGWFENQIEERRAADQQMLSDSFVKIAGVVLGQRRAEMICDDRIVTKKAIDEILKYYHFKPVDVPEKMIRPEEQVEYCLRPYGMMRRSIELKKGWYKDAFGPVLAFTKTEKIPVAVLPGKFRGYYYLDGETGKKVWLNAGNEDRFEKDAMCFYKPLPLRKIGIPDLLLYMKNCVTMNDVIMILAATLAFTLVGLLLPRITKALTGPVLESGQAGALIGIGICIVCISVSMQLIGSIRGLIVKRLEMKTSLGVQASMMMRLISLPASFFRKYSAGELKSRSMAVSTLCSLLMGIVMTAVLTSLSSLLYVTQIFRFAPVLVVPALIILLVSAGFSILSAVMRTRINRKMMEAEAKESGMSYSLITGIQKIRLSGAEKRFFAKWMDVYAEGADLAYNQPLFFKVSGVVNTAIGLFSTIILYYLAVRGEVDQSSYFAFSAAYGVVMGTFSVLSETAVSAARIKPILEMAEPFLEAEPETSEGREIVTGISGGIELDHVSFRYSEDTPYVLNDLSMKIRPGEYVAVVGRTGCGKSTLLRLLLGFEKPEKGSIFYDGKDINSLDPASLRKKIGTVMQDAGLFQGDIYSNIVITAPYLTLDDAWEAAEKAGIAEDIRKMPMGMQTVIAEGQGGISGGQKQRIMIARAIAPKPKLLLFDEATSALDNKTQRQVSDALDAMGCTRLVIAHRLSTIRHCDRILVLEGGNIIEDGTYAELIEKGGFFAQLVERQRLETAG